MMRKIEENDLASVDQPLVGTTSTVSAAQATLSFDPNKEDIYMTSSLTHFYQQRYVGVQTELVAAHRAANNSEQCVCMVPSSKGL